MDTKDHAVDINMMTDVLMPETDVKGGLSLPNEEQLLFRIPKNKSVLASELTNESRTEISVESTGRETRKDGSLMTFAQSKKMPQLTADNAQWEDRRLLRSGSVRGAEVQMEFEDEDERKVILVFHDTKPPFLDGMVNTKQAEPVMLVKDPTSHMAIIARKGSSLVRHIHEKQFMDKFRQEFWEEFTESKLGQNWVDADGNAA